jgi:hypothetical protein
MLRRLRSGRSEECAHLTNDFILSVNEAVMVRVGQHQNPAVWNLLAKALHLFLFQLATLT